MNFFFCVCVLGPIHRISITDIDSDALCWQQFMLFLTTNTIENTYWICTSDQRPTSKIICDNSKKNKKKNKFDLQKMCDVRSQRPQRSSYLNIFVCRKALTNEGCMYVCARARMRECGHLLLCTFHSEYRRCLRHSPQFHNSKWKLIKLYYSWAGYIMVRHIGCVGLWEARNYCIFIEIVS